MNDAADIQGFSIFFLGFLSFYFRASYSYCRQSCTEVWQRDRINGSLILWLTIDRGYSLSLYTWNGPIGSGTILALDLNCFRCAGREREGTLLDRRYNIVVAMGC